ncbi:MAG TPA: hypothetical protein PKD85_22265, partial [Saprospiraceae bacterium]|nr:hypothetical protein [Saprospiraceae bacterium]
SSNFTFESDNNSFAGSKPGVRHLFQTSKTGSPDEYPLIEETFSEEVLNDMSKWINEVAKK